MAGARRGTTRNATRIPRPARPRRMSTPNGARSARNTGPRNREVGRVRDDFSEPPGPIGRGVRFIEDEPIGVEAFPGPEVAGLGGLLHRQMGGELIEAPLEDRVLPHAL